MKKNFTKIIVLSIMFLGMMMWTSATKAQNYQTILWDNYADLGHVPYCTCDSVKCIPPAGVTEISWSPGLTQHGDTLVVPGTFNGGITCFWNGGQKIVIIHPIAIPTQPTFTNQNICGIETVTLDAENHSTYGFTTYAWSTGASTQTITVGAGSYQVTVSNACGQISRPVTIVENNPNQPNLGPDITPCQGSTVVLDPGTGYSNYLWIPGNTSDSTLSPTTTGMYVVQTTNTVGGCVDRDTVQVTFLAPPNQDIDLVTIDTTNGNNRITWSNMYNEAITMNIYRELTTNNYILIGSAPYDNLTWTDTVSSKNQAWRYKIAIVDSCGNEGTLSSYVQSIHTWVTLGVGGYTVQWTPYQIETKEAVSQYNIYHGTTLSALSYLTFVSGSATVYTLTNFVDSIYIVGAQLSAKGSSNDALSNWICQSDAVGINDINLTDQISITPTITNGPVTITTDLTIKDIKLYNSLGQVFLITKEKRFDIPYHGVCFIHITTDKGVMDTKVIVQ